jgi:hypothetical protein
MVKCCDQKSTLFSNLGRGEYIYVYSKFELRDIIVFVFEYHICVLKKLKAAKPPCHLRRESTRCLTT